MDSTIRGIPLADEPLGALTLGGFLREVCAKNANKEALVFHPASGPVIRRTYREIWDESLSIACALIARGVSKDSRVGLLASNRPEWVTGLYGIALTGATCVSLSTFAKGAELEYQLRVGDVSLLLFERSLLGRDFATEIIEICPELATARDVVYSTRLPFLRRAVCIGELPQSNGAIETWTALLESPLKAPAAIVDALAAEIAPTDRAMIFFSSGSTAKPKSIAHTHRAAAMQSWRWPLIAATDPDVRTWAANGFFWSGNFCMALGGTLAAGGCLVLQRTFDPGEALRLMQDEKVTYPIAWPHQWVRLVEDPAYSKVDLSSLKYVGDTSPLRNHPTVQTDWDEPVWAYGNSETMTINAIFPSGTPLEIANGTHGVPQAGNTLRIVDPMTGQVLPRGESGEIAVKGPTLMLGYLRVPPEESFDEEGFFRTGDGGFVDEQGRLHWHGRLNDIIKTGGANVSPLEINAVLLECPGVKIAATVGVPHDTLGEMVVSCIVPEPGATFDEATIRKFVSQRLSSYKVPRRVLFVAESDLELTSSNKVKTGPLRELATRRLAGE